jgi:glycosyltransferase involved in cell wall biosynthesis
MHVLILGGTPDHLGGVEAFCARSAMALRLVRPDWRIHTIATATAYLNISRLPNFLRAMRQIAAYRRKRPDVVWVQYVNFPDLLVVLFARILGLRIMVTPHLGSNWRSQQSPLLRRASQWLLGLATRIALISRTQEQEIALPADVPRSLVRNFLPEAVLKGALPPTVADDAPVTLMHSARLSADKGSFMVVELAARLKASGANFQTWITGGADQETYATLDALIAKHGVAEWVKVLGRIPEEELLERLRRADVLVHLSRIDSYPLIILEALASSTPAIAMELAGARDMIETYDGRIVSQTDPVGEAAAWLAEVSLPDLRARGRKQADHVRRDYDWHRCAEALALALIACRDNSAAWTEPPPA